MKFISSHSLHEQGFTVSNSSIAFDNSSSADESRSGWFHISNIISRLTNKLVKLCSFVALSMGACIRDGASSILSSIVMRKLFNIALLFLLHQVLISNQMLWSQSIWLHEPMTMIRPVDYNKNKQWQSQATAYDIVYRIVKSECAELCVRKDLTPYSIKFGRMSCGECSSIGFTVFHRIQEIKFGPFGLMKVKVFRKKD